MLVLRQANYSDTQLESAVMSSLTALSSRNHHFSPLSSEMASEPPVTTSRPVHSSILVRAGYLYDLHAGTRPPHSWGTYVEFRRYFTTVTLMEQASRYRLVGCGSELLSMRGPLRREIYRAPVWVAIVLSSRLSGWCVQSCEAKM